MAHECLFDCGRKLAKQPTHYVVNRDPRRFCSIDCVLSFCRMTGRVAQSEYASSSRPTRRIVAVSPSDPRLRRKISLEKLQYILPL